MILITGGNGRIGNVLVKELNKRGEKVKVLIRETSKLESLDKCHCEYIYGDVRDLSNLNHELEDVEAIFHLAAHINISLYGKKITLDTNIQGTKNVASLCLKNKIPLIYTSTIHAFDAPKDNCLITEETPLKTDCIKTNSLYDYSKGCAAEYIQEQISNGLEVITVYPTGVTGPYDYRPSFFGKGMIGLIKSGVKTVIDGEFDYVDVRDVVQYMIKAYELKKFGERYILSGEILTMGDFAKYLKEFENIKTDTKILNYKTSLFVAYLSSLFNRASQITPYSVKTLHSNCNVSSEKAKRELGYTTRSIKESIFDQYTWFKEHGYFN